MNPNPNGKSRLTWDAASFILNGKREFVVSGEMHYARAPREEWAGLLDQSVALGLNHIATYVFWGWHEPKRDIYDFSGDRDLGYFLRLCGERGLRVILRVGPYCCAEWNFGGFPAYLRDEPGIKFRTWNASYTARIEKYFKHLFAEFVPYLASKGGCVSLVQVENEYANVGARYGEAGIRYNVWMAELTRSLGVDVPLIMCESGGAEIPGVITTVNGFSIPAERIDASRKSQPDVPVIWTELWPAWYNTWGYQRHLRDPRNIAFHLLDFIGNGGSGWNYYMWYGGTNFGRNSMYLQTTCYDVGTLINEHGGVTLKGKFLGKLHQVLKPLEDIILGGSVDREPSRVVWSKNGDSVVLERDASARTARLMDGAGTILFDTSDTFNAVEAGFKEPDWENLVTIADWRSWPEPLPSHRNDGIESEAPVEQLSLTKDESDYTWYAAKITVNHPGEQAITITHGGDVFSVFLDGALVGRTKPPLLENRGPTTAEEATPMEGGVYVNPLEVVKGQYSHTFVFPAERGAHRLEILAASLGLIKGDWMVSGPMETERKGIWGKVLHNGKEISHWTMHPLLVGERLGVISETDAVRWQDGSPARACSWCEASFDIPAERLVSDLHYRLDADGWGKGMLFINGHALGRHWLIEAHGYGADQGWHNAELNGLSLGPEGEPTQRYYKIPPSWLKSRNRLVIFEEQGLANRMSLTVQIRNGN